MKYYKTEHYKGTDNALNIYISWYTTKTGMLKFNIKVYAEHSYNNNGFCSCIANYNTSDNALLKYLRLSKNFVEV